MSGTTRRRKQSKRGDGSSKSSPAASGARNDQVAPGSNPRFSSSKGVGALRQGKAAKPATKKAARTVALKSGVKTAEVGQGSPAGRVNSNVKAMPFTGKKKSQPGKRSYPSKRLMAIMDADERARYQ